MSCISVDSQDVSFVSLLNDCCAKHERHSKASGRVLFCSAKSMRYLRDVF